MRITTILKEIELPKEINIKEFHNCYFPYIQNICKEEGWLTFVEREEKSMNAFLNSNICLVILDNKKVIGYLRGITDKHISTYIAELLIQKDYRGQGLGSLLLEVSHRMYPECRLEVLATSGSKDYYEYKGFRPFYGMRKGFI
ncbi:GNAT family N-acetyltransferase [Clostridium sp. D2Q-11]|uniref:GNAT family N-acetyltransferase n=1 Tax=Anaeromonas frigoriresistens TaxID=2683708 RepID=A0A942Z9A7_9FIRM|nr:GNAT family N-acetyltransferase [Anaeromonas frigoriresistens]MBS4538685.1 GNAT family N-acetyltransferase [Anaeromonas frigoriresistens]